MAEGSEQVVLLIVGVLLAIAAVVALAYPYVLKQRDNSGQQKSSPFIAAGVLLASCAVWMMSLYLSPDEPLTLEANLLKQAAELNQSLPKMLDENTRFDEVIVQGTDISYRHTVVSRASDQLDSTVFQSIMTEKLVKEQCPKAELEELLRRGVRYHYDYYGNRGILVSSVVISKEVCGIR